MNSRSSGLDYRCGPVCDENQGSSGRDPCVINPGTLVRDHSCGPVCDESQFAGSGIAAVDECVMNPGK